MVYDAPEFTKGFLFDQRVSYFFSKTGKPFKTVDGKLTIELDAEGKITRLGACSASARADPRQSTNGARHVDSDRPLAANAAVYLLTAAAYRARHAQGHPRRARLCVEALGVEAHSPDKWKRMTAILSGPILPTDPRKVYNPPTTDRPNA